MADDLRKLAEAAKAALARYDLGEAKRADAEAVHDFDVACTPDAIEALYRERDEALMAMADAIYDQALADPGSSIWTHTVALCFEKMSAAEASLASAQEEVARYKIALADATRRPMGVLPASADGLVTAADMAAAEARRTHHGADPRALNPDTLRYGNKRFKPKETPNER
jgi:hypothetical protein